jgi:excisionase family DNA binding protein
MNVSEQQMGPTEQSPSVREPSPAPSPSRGNGRGYLRAAEAAALLHVSPKTISRWAREGKLGHVVTLGGHRRFSRSEIEALAERMIMSEES